MDYDAIRYESMDGLTRDDVDEDRHHHHPSLDDYDDGMYDDDYAFSEGDYAFYYEGDDGLSLQSLWSDCALPVLSSSLSSAASLTLLSLALPVLRRAAASVGGGSSGGAPASALLHLSSAGLGLGALLLFFPASWFVLAAIGVGAASLLLLLLPPFFGDRRGGVFLAASALGTFIPVFQADAEFHRRKI